MELALQHGSDKSHTVISLAVMDKGIKVMSPVKALHS